MKSNFNEDLSKEALLGEYLDKIYPSIFENSEIRRIVDLDSQNQGIDLIITKGGNSYNIDEKAQLDYLEVDLPTFAFEISYLKNGERKSGWLFDLNKLTDYYFTITAISCKEYKIPESGFKSCKIYSVNHKALLKLLDSKGLSKDRVIQIDTEIREGSLQNAIAIEELNPSTEGKFFYSKSGKAEQPINLVLKLRFLVEMRVAKKIY